MTGHFATVLFSLSRKKLLQAHSRVRSQKAKPDNPLPTSGYTQSVPVRRGTLFIDFPPKRPQHSPRDHGQALTLLCAATPLLEVASQQDEVSDDSRARAGTLTRLIGQEGSAPMAAAKKSPKGG